MPLSPDKIEKLARARADLRMGVPVAIAGGLVAAIETCDATRLADLRALGPVELVITDWRAKTLKARLYDGDVARIRLPEGADLDWIQAVANPVTDLAAPMKGPLMTEREGSANLARAGVALAKSAQLLPAVLAVRLGNAEGFALANDLTFADVQTLLDQNLAALSLVARARVPMVASEAGKVHVIRSADGSAEHYAIEIGQPDRAQPVLARLHSACFTGDVLGSLKCDCGPQLRAALTQMGDEGEGVLLYLNQEGRGIGLANKMRAYALQDQGFDTVEANHRLGFEDDERDFRIGAEILRGMGFSAVRLMTNNPAKIARMEGCGISVTERVPLRVGETAFNKDYLATKALKSGHLL